LAISEPNRNAIIPSAALANSSPKLVPIARNFEGQVHEVAGIGFAGVKGFAGGFENRMPSAFGEEAIKHFVAEV
jgi:hypothetical protein